MNRPLATRMRPNSIDEILGQDHLIGEGKILTRIVESKNISSILLFGPPGIGKTSIAHALSNDLNLPFEYYNAGVHTKKDLEKVTKNGKPNDPVIVLIDEVHRLDKPKQDFLLMMIEEGSVVLVGATTENPYISINPALRSRSQIFELKPISVKSIVEKLKLTINDERGLKDYNIDISDKSLKYIAERSNGDLRIALNTLELAVTSTKPIDDIIVVNKDIIDTCLQERLIGGDKDGESHYNLLSAFQKSIRGSDVDASLHYLARLLKSGDIISINRRLLVIAYEDIGLANPMLPIETLNAITTAERIGLPEARIPLSHITIRLALSEKSNISYRAVDKASKELNSNKDLSIAKVIQDTHYKGAKKLGRGIGYKYAHDYPYGIVKQQFLPDDFKDDKYLDFRDDSDTSEIQEKYRKINKFLKE